jgi:hypothetical protein
MDLGAGVVALAALGADGRNDGERESALKRLYSPLERGRKRERTA